MGWQGYDNEGCMPGDRERLLRLQEGARSRGQSSPSYTLAELNRLTEQWAIKRKILASERWLVICFLAWLANNSHRTEQRSDDR